MRGEGWVRAMGKASFFPRGLERSRSASVLIIFLRRWRVYCLFRCVSSMDVETVGRARLFKRFRPLAFPRAVLLFAGYASLKSLMGVAPKKLFTGDHLFFIFPVLAFPPGSNGSLPVASSAARFCWWFFRCAASRRSSTETVLWCTGGASWSRAVLLLLWLCTHWFLMVVWHAGCALGVHCLPPQSLVS